MAYHPGQVRIIQPGESGQLFGRSGYLDTSMEQGRRSGVAKPDELVLLLPDGARTDDPVEVDLPFMWGTREAPFTTCTGEGGTFKLIRG